LPKKSKYEWDIHSPPPIEEHSLVKQEILRTYLEEYISTLCSNHLMDELKLTIVDGFCGGGLYTHQSGEYKLGSPLIALNAVHKAERKIQSQKKKPFSIKAEFHFIDTDKQALAMLKKLLVEHGHECSINESIFLHDIPFSETVPDLVNKINKRQPLTQRAIFILDQYNYTDVPLPLIRYIFSSLNHPEIILTFGKDLLINYLTNNQAYRKILNGIGLSAEEIEYLATIKENGHGWKRKAQAGLSATLFKHSLAKHYTPFFIKSKVSNQAYWLVHLSNHVKARNVMTDLHWAQHNTFQHFGGAGLNMLGFDATKLAHENQSVFEFDQAANLLLQENMANDLTV